MGDSRDGRCFAVGLECSRTGKAHDIGILQGASESGAPLLVRYDLDAVSRSVDPAVLANRPADMWRYRELLPHPDGCVPVSLGEIRTPLITLGRSLINNAGPGTVLVKDEGRLPTGSFKARGLALAVTMARFFGVERIAMPTAGNAGAALAAYAARAGIESFVFAPADAPDVTLREAALHGARVRKVDGLIDACGRLVAEGAESRGWFDLSTLREPYRIEGKKTMGLELAEQMGWRAPDAIFYPTGGGTGLIGMWKAFRELRTLGWLDGPLPRMIVVQTSGCCPIVRAFESGAEEVEHPWKEVTTSVHGVRVPKPFGDRLILSALRESDGFAIAAADEQVEPARSRVAALDGMHLCPEGAACFVAYQEALEKGVIGKGDKVVLFNSASGLKSPMPEVTDADDG